MYALGSFRGAALYIAAACCFTLPCPAAEPAGEEGKPKHTNRLAEESSPYLLGHAHNPVDWYPWGPEALAKAKVEGKVIFLSVGYSSCHWCHVMERETFLDEEIAKFLNEHFVCIKVDREERPDVDTIYMTAVQVLTQRGGWPMSVFLTPEGKPFFGGTYFPARDGDRPGITGFLTLAEKVQGIWKESPDRVKEGAEQLTEMVQRELSGRTGAALTPLDAAWLASVQEALAEQFDATYGGFGYTEANPRVPKFPEPSNLVFLLHRAETLPAGETREAALEMLTRTLDGMAQGGIRDHLGGGFHRYSVDRYWRIPHFEKMLYDQGQLLSVYARAYRLTGNEEYRRVAEELIAFLEREMLAPGGGFYAALDAESEGEEGKFQRWEKKEIRGLLSETEYALFAPVYGLESEPNFEEKYYVPQMAKSRKSLAEERGLSEAELEAQLGPIRAKLLAARNKRVKPLTDVKILTSWNGLMITGLADAGRLLEEPRYTQLAARAADFVLSELREVETGRLLRTHTSGKAKLNAYLDDYAFLIEGLLALYAAEGDAKRLAQAEELMKLQLELFADEDRGGFYFTSDDHESLIARAKNPIDGALPAGGSVAAGNLLRLAALSKNDTYRKKAESTLNSVGGLLARLPSAAPRMAIVVDETMNDE